MSSMLSEKTISVFNNQKIIDEYGGTKHVF